MLSTEGQRLTCDYLLVTIPCVRYTNRIKKGLPCNHIYEFTHKGCRGVHLQSIRTQRRYNDFVDTPHFAMKPYGKKAKFTYRFEPVGCRPHIQQMHATAAKKGVSRIITIGKAAKQVANLVHGYLKEEPLFTANGRRLAFGELYLTQLKQQNATLVISLGYYETSTPTALPLSSTAVTPLPPSSPLSPPPPPMSIPHTAAQPLPASSPKALSLHTPQVPSSTPHRTSLPFSTVAVAATQHQSLPDDPAWSPYYTSDTHVTHDAYTATFGLLPATPSTTASATPAQSWAYSDDSVWTASSTVPQHDYPSIPRQMWAPGAPIEDPGLYAFDVASDPTPLTSTFFESWAPSSSSASTSQEADFGFFDPTGTVDETVLDLLAQANVGQPQNYHYHYYPFGS